MQCCQLLLECTVQTDLGIVADFEADEFGIAKSDYHMLVPEESTLIKKSNSS